MRRRSCAPAPVLPTSPRLSYEKRLSSSLDIATFHSLYLYIIGYSQKEDTVSTATTPKGSAGRWGPLWNERAADWARIEDQQVPTYEEALRRVDLSQGEAVLEVACGSGVFL